MVHLVGVGGHEFSVGRLAGYRSPFTESTLTLGLSRPAVVYTCVYEFENANSWKPRKNPAPPKTHNEIHSSPATATTSRRRATKHVPRVSPYSPASSIDTGFVEIGLAQLSQSVKTTNVTYRLQTETNKIMAPCTKHPKRGVLPKGKK